MKITEHFLYPVGQLAVDPRIYILIQKEVCFFYDLFFRGIVITLNKNDLSINKIDNNVLTGHTQIQPNPGQNSNGTQETEEDPNIPGIIRYHVCQGTFLSKLNGLMNRTSSHSAVYFFHRTKLAGRIMKGGGNFRFFN